MFRPDLRVVYVLDLDPESGHLRELELVPFVSRRLRLDKAPDDDSGWLAERLTKESRRLGTRFSITSDHRLLACW